MSKIAKVLVGLILATSFGTAWATSYTVTGLSNRTSGFGENVLHTSDSSGSASGSTIATFNSVSGNYNSTSGVLNLLFGVSGGNSVAVSGSVFKFLNPNGTLSTGPTTANVTLNGNFGSGYNNGNIYAVTFDNGVVCCGSSTYPPNSLVADGNLLILTLWGAGQLLGSDGQTSSDFIGIDIQVELTQVPLPGAIILFGTAIAGLMGIARRRRLA